MSRVYVAAVETFEKRYTMHSYYPMEHHCVDYSELVRILNSCGDGKDEERFYEVKQLPEGVREWTEMRHWS